MPQGTHWVIPVEACLLHQPVLDEAIEAVRKAVREFKYPVYDEDIKDRAGPPYPGPPQSFGGSGPGCAGDGIPGAAGRKSFWKKSAAALS